MNSKDFTLGEEYFRAAEQLEARAAELGAGKKRITSMSLLERICILKNEAMELRIIGKRLQR